MTSKEFVKQHMPNAKAEKHTTRNIMKNESYWLIRDGNTYMYYVEGKTESNAWKNAKERLIKELENDK